MPRAFSRRRLSNNTKGASALPFWPEAEKLPRKAEARCCDDERPPNGEPLVFVNQRAVANRDQHRFYAPDFPSPTRRWALGKAGVGDIQLKNSTRHSRADRRLKSGMSLANAG